MGFVLLSNDGIRAMMFYLFAYYVMDAGAFLVVMIVANATGREDIERLPRAGVARRIGTGDSAGDLPVLADRHSATVGFIGKFYLFAAVIRRQFYVLALVGILNSVVSLYYYMRPIRTMFLDQPRGDETRHVTGRDLELRPDGRAGGARP